MKEFKYTSCLIALGSNHHVVIVGGGPSSQVCAETLRSSGFGGKVTIINKENHQPYDRAKLSKALDTEPEKIYLRKDDDFYTKINVDILKGTVSSASNLIIILKELHQAFITAMDA